MALGAATFTDIGGGVSDLFAAQGYAYKAEGDEFEKQNYDAAAVLADQNAAYTETATAIKEAQQGRQIFKAQGETEQSVAGAGFAESGSALDILREGAQQGALSQAVLGQQGLIQEAGYKEQAQSYRNMSSAAQVAIDAAHEAETGADITGGIKLLAGIGTLLL
jgi:hypothetical protein